MKKIMLKPYIVKSIHMIVDSSLSGSNLFVEQIRSFPSKEFYDEALEDGSDVEDQTTREWHKYRCFGPFCFFDIHEGKESQPSGSGSWVNTDEIEFVLALYNKLITMHPELKSSSQFAIISPYRHQVKLLQERFQETFGVESKRVVDIGTIDGFQVIFLCPAFINLPFFLLRHSQVNC